MNFFYFAQCFEQTCCETFTVVSDSNSIKVLKDWFSGESNHNYILEKAVDDDK